MPDLVTEEQLIPPGAVEVHAPYGFVRLVECNASDLDVVNAARVSFAKESEWANEMQVETTGDSCDGILKAEDAAVLRFLLKNHHGTPFEHTFFKFHVRAPIFVFREWHRHRIGISINEESARYTPLQPHFYFPEGDRWRGQVGKPGRYTFEPIADEAAIASHDAAMSGAYEHAYRVYESLMMQGVAKEIARAVLPVGIYSQMYWTCNARSLMAFLNLRNAPTAQREIRDYAAAMEGIFATIMPATHAAFEENGRIAP